MMVPMIDETRQLALSTAVEVCTAQLGPTSVERIVEAAEAFHAFLVGPRLDVPDLVCGTATMDDLTTGREIARHHRQAALGDALAAWEPDEDEAAMMDASAHDAAV